MNKLQLNGRRIITTTYNAITKDKIVAVINETMPFFSVNQEQIEYLFNYHKGIQPILDREKVWHKEINNKIVENHAREIVAFKVGYLLMKPIQYVSRKPDTDALEIETLNDYMVLEDKEGQDRRIAVHQSICGTSYRLCLPNKKYDISDDESPFKVYSVHPKNAYVIYSSDFKQEPLAGVIVDRVYDAGGALKIRQQVYTETMFFEIINGVLTKAEAHTYNYIPLVEYPLNDERLGDFEQVIDMLDAINLTQSNRLDGVEEFVQALMVFKNFDIKDEDVKKLKELGAIKIKDGSKEMSADVKYLTQELNQSQVQTLVDCLYNIVLRIVGMPSTSDGNSSDSSNNGAVILKNGWQGADARANDTEIIFKTSERKFLKLVLGMTRTMTLNKVNVSLVDLDIKFTRRNYENLWQKAQTLDLMLKNDKIAPQLAFLVCGLFTDSEEAYTMSKEYYDAIVKQGQQIVNDVTSEDNER